MLSWKWRAWIRIWLHRTAQRDAAHIFFLRSSSSPETSQVTGLFLGLKRNYYSRSSGQIFFIGSPSNLMTSVIKIPRCISPEKRARRARILLSSVGLRISRSNSHAFSLPLLNGPISMGSFWLHRRPICRDLMAN